ncbi:MAG: O-antigen ligase family protein [Chloroflexi bacterium]|nr:O-antigen ligase family protein [Chloroflexota bacterium]
MLALKFPRNDSFFHIYTLTLIVIALSLVIAVMPPMVAVAAILIVAWFALAATNPLFALAFAIILGPTKALYAAALPNEWIDLGQVGFALIVVSWLFRGLAKRELKIPAITILIPFAIYLVAITLSLTVQQPRAINAAVNELLKWVEMLITAIIVVDLTVGADGRPPLRKRIGWLVAIIIASGVLQTMSGVWEWGFRGIGPAAFRIFGDTYRAYGTFEQPNPYAGYLGMIWTVAIAMGVGLIIVGAGLAPAQRATARVAPTNVWVGLIALAGGAASLIGLYLSFSRGAWIGAAAAGIIMLIFVPRRRWIGIGLATLGAIIFFTLYSLNLLPSAIASRFADVGSFFQVYDVRGVHVNDSNFAIVERVAHWQAAVNMAEANPIFGVGLGNYEAAYETYRLVKWQYALGHAHNIYLNTLAETGALGLAGYLILWGSIFAVTIRVIHRAGGVERALAIGLLGTWTHLMTHQFLDNLYVNNVHLLIGALLGLLCLLSADRRTFS